MNNFTKDQQESIWLIVGLLAFAAVTFTGGALLAASHLLIALLLFICGLFLTAIAYTGYYVEFVEKSKD